MTIATLLKRTGGSTHNFFILISVTFTLGITLLAKFYDTGIDFTDPGSVAIAVCTMCIVYACIWMWTRNLNRD